MTAEPIHAKLLSSPWLKFCFLPATTFNIKHISTDVFRTYQAIFTRNKFTGAGICLFIPSTLYAVHCAIMYGFFMVSGNLQEKEFYLLNSYTLFSCILLRKIIISTSPCMATRYQKQERLPYFIHYMSDDKRLLLQTFPATFRPKLKLV